MLEEAVNELAGEQAALTAPVRVDLPVTAYVPPEYIAYEATKIDAHRRIARARTIGELGDVRAELADRFGAPPEPVENLITLQAIRTRRRSSARPPSPTAGAVCRSTDSISTTRQRRAYRTSNDRATFFKKDRMLAVHREGQEPSLLGGSRLCSMLYSPLVCLTTGRQSPGRENL